jgi:hypothetical protein
MEPLSRRKSYQSMGVALSSFSAASALAKVLSASARMRAASKVRMSASGGPPVAVRSFKGRSDWK